MNEQIIESSGNVFADLGVSPEESTLLGLRSGLMNELRQTLQEKNWTQQQAAAALGVSQARISDLMRGKWEKFSLDMLVTLASHAGRKISLMTHA
ncbi:helix-turn-helix domain-containing protein [Iodobacter ciconiae]|uniref:XRE family transcriptional regulator n=1 Tax=Iodobacter ciconiae TaxID=2496266 RepID=A0A3S8ZP77_9NEIS|nr:XRE family transcriptional regulator [Iodobacter ciconiae]AZN35280.1 XRE family transcriptional regulator [Iodobacter ciconiae]